MIVFADKAPATLPGVSLLRDALARRLEELRISTAIRDDMVLAAAETWNNIVLHGNPCASLIETTVRLEGARLLLEVRDDGGPFVAFAERLAAARIAAGALDFAESGRGMGLIANALEGVVYEPGRPNRMTGWRRLYARRPRILIVEDDEAQREMYAAFLTGEWDVVTAGSVDEARIVAASVACDVIVSDLHVGADDGASLPEMIDADEQHIAPAFVSLSADEETAARRRALGSGSEFFLRKPVTGAALRESVTLALQRHSAREVRLAHRFMRHVDSLWSSTPPPYAHGVDIVSCTGTASAGGGDIIVHHPEPSRTRIALADVMGHGLGAKAWSIAFAAALRAFLHQQPGDSPGELLCALNALVCRDEAFGAALATIIVFDILPGGRIAYASAGHPAPFHLRSDGVRHGGTCGPLLGVVEGAAYETQMIALRANERLILTTDGVDAADVAAGGPLPHWLIEACATEDLFQNGARAISVAATQALGVQPADDWTVLVLACSPRAAA